MISLDEQGQGRFLQMAGEGERESDALRDTKRVKRVSRLIGRS